MGSHSAHILRMLGIPPDKGPPGLIYNQRAQSNEFLLPDGDELLDLTARFQSRLRIRTWCRIKTDSATTERSPPGRASRKRMTITYRKRANMSRMSRIVSELKTSRIHGACGIRHPQAKWKASDRHHPTISCLSTCHATVRSHYARLLKDEPRKCTSDRTELVAAPLMSPQSCRSSRCQLRCPDLQTADG